MSDKTGSKEANERGQKDGSTDDWYSGWMYSGDERDAYNSGYENGQENPAKSDD